MRAEKCLYESLYPKPLSLLNVKVTPAHSAAITSAVMYGVKWPFVSEIILYASPLCK